MNFMYFNEYDSTLNEFLKHHSGHFIKLNIKVLLSEFSVTCMDIEILQGLRKRCSYMIRKGMSTTNVQPCHATY